MGPHLSGSSVSIATIGTLKVWHRSSRGLSYSRRYFLQEELQTKGFPVFSVHVDLPPIFVSIDRISKIHDGIKSVNVYLH